MLVPVGNWRPERKPTARSPGQRCSFPTTTGSLESGQMRIGKKDGVTRDRISIGLSSNQLFNNIGLYRTVIYHNVNLEYFVHQQQHRGRLEHLLNPRMSTCCTALESVHLAHELGGIRPAGKALVPPSVQWDGCFHTAVGPRLHLFCPLASGASQLPCGMARHGLTKCRAKAQCIPSLLL